MSALPSPLPSILKFVKPIGRYSVLNIVNSDESGFFIAFEKR